MFSLFNFSSIYPGGQLTQFALMCGRPWLIVVVALAYVSCPWRYMRPNLGDSDQSFSFVTGRERNFSFHLEVETTLLTSRFSTNATCVVLRPTPKSAFLETTRMTSLTSLPFADITLGVLNDYAQYKTTHSLTH